jgi:hypothetical protein
MGGIKVKKTLIGGIFMISGVLTTASVLITAGLFVPTITRWSGSKLWHAIFGAKQYGSQPVQSLFLGFPFIIGVALAVLGFIILAREYFDK